MLLPFTLLHFLHFYTFNSPSFYTYTYVYTLAKILLFGNLAFDDDVNQGILRAVMTFILSTRCFDGSLFGER